MNTIHYVDVAPDGTLYGAGTTCAPTLEGMPGVRGELHVTDHAVDDPAEWYWAGGKLATRPPKPEFAATFDPATGLWVLDETRAWQQVRDRRRQLLAASDWVTLRAQEQGTPVPAEWVAYRQALRDITEQPDPTQITWPEPP
jgi:hypothetical protein